MVPGLPAEESAKLAEMAPWICEAVVDAQDFWVAGRTEPCRLDWSARREQNNEPAPSRFIGGSSPRSRRHAFPTGLSRGRAGAGGEPGGAGPTMAYWSGGASRRPGRSDRQVQGGAVERRVERYRLLLHLQLSRVTFAG